MKETVHKISSIAMALLLLVSTTSWKVEKHFCKGHLVDIAFFASPDDCCMSIDNGMDGEMTGQLEEETCCSNEVTVVIGQDDLKLSYNDSGGGEQLIVRAFTNTNLDLFAGLKAQIVPHKHYPPPLLVKEIYSLDQVFLI